ncbi:hypothetical protein E3U43_007638 [Larimichthys crocea]|nr:hypothetical protein E3U43_007638 [Larimichthys crocea]
MDSEEDELSNTETTGDTAEAAKTSPASTERSSGRRGSKRRMKTAVISADSRGSVRVLRSRGAAAGRASESKDDACKKKPTIVQRGRGRPAGSRSKNTPAVQPVIKKPTAKKASRHALEPKPSKSTKDKARPPTRASRTKPPPTACKPEAEMEASSCGEEAGAVKGSDDNVADSDAALDEDPPFRDDPNDLIYEPETKTEKPRRRTTIPQKEVKKEESEKEDEENDVNKERPRVNIVFHRRRKKD